MGNDAKTGTCPHCGETISASAKVCEHCGGSLQEVFPAEPVQTYPLPGLPSCPRCGGRIELGAKSCVRCGKSIPSDRIDPYGPLRMPKLRWNRPSSWYAMWMAGVLDLLFITYGLSIGHFNISEVGFTAIRYFVYLFVFSLILIAVPRFIWNQIKRI